MQAIGLGAAIDYVNSIGKARVRAHEAELVQYAHERLREINSLRIYGTTKDKGPIVSFELKGAHPHDVATIIDRAGIAVRAGTHCVMPLLARFGLTATCRASFGLYNTREEIDGLDAVLDQGTGILLMSNETSKDLNSAPSPAAAVSTAGPLAPSTAPDKGAALPQGEMARLTDEVIAALKTVYDPEIPSDIFELGLIYKIDISDDRAVTIEMTLTTPNCPSAQELPLNVENAVASVPGVREAKVEIVWDPPWDPSRMSDEARSVLNMW